MKINIRILYLYLFSAIGLIVSVMGAVRLIELSLKTFVFKGADTYEYVKPLMPYPSDVKISSEEADKLQTEERFVQERETLRQRQREASGALAMLFVGVPLYLYHWKVIRKGAN